MFTKASLRNDCKYIKSQNMAAVKICLNSLSANPTKWSNTLKNCLSAFDHFVGLARKGLKIKILKGKVRRINLK